MGGGLPSQGAYTKGDVQNEEEEIERLLVK